MQPFFLFLIFLKIMWYQLAFIVISELCEYHNYFELSIHSGILKMYYNHIF